MRFVLTLDPGVSIALVRAGNPSGGTSRFIVGRLSERDSFFEICIMNMRDLAESFSPFMDEVGTVFLVVRVDGQPDDHDLPLASDSARQLVQARLCSLMRRGFPTDSETATAIEIIGGVAYGQPRRSPRNASDLQVGLDPLARAVIALARVGGTTQTLAELRTRLAWAAASEDIPLRPEDWPRNEDCLGRRLAGLIPSLAQRGVSLVRNVTARPRTWTLGPLMDSSVGSVELETVANLLNRAASGGCDTSGPVSDEEKESPTTSRVLEDPTRDGAGLPRNAVSIYEVESSGDSQSPGVSGSPFRNGAVA